MAVRRVVVKMYLFIFIINISFVKSYIYTSGIKLQQGILKGVDFGGYNAYLGVPYASIPVRFQEPGTASSWSNIFYATDGNIKCNQILPILNIPVGKEDCLVANIYTPKENKKHDLLPVMVFIHGGGFQYGSNTNLLYDAKYLTQKGVIVVAINYRLGAFGFLCLNKTGASGNMGFKDQIAALRWINQNIKHFGGDPNLITLVGESAGATSVQYITMSNLARGLFNRTIMESGSLLVPIGFDQNPTDKAIFLASKLGHNTTELNDILTFLQNIDATELTKASFIDGKNDISKPYIFQPCAEDPKVSKNPFLTTSPRELLKKYHVDPNLNIIIGINNKEGIMFAGQFDSIGLQEIDNDLSKILPRNLHFKNKHEKFKVLKDIRRLYFGNNPITTSNYDGLVNFFSDCLIVYPSIETTEYFLQRNATVFNYIFKYDSIRNLNKFISGLPYIPGANHADELFYIFDPILYKLFPPFPKDRKIIDLMTNSWTNFAKTGIPSASDVNWIQSEKEQMNFLSIGNQGIEIIPQPFKDRMHFWKNVYQKYAAF